MHLHYKIALFLQEGGRLHEPPWSADIIGVALHNYLQLNQMFAYSMHFCTRVFILDYDTVTKIMATWNN